MNGAALVALGATVALALVDWWAVARGDTRVEYAAKPLTMAALLAFALLLDPSSDLDVMRGWFVAAVAFSLVGDVLLMIPGDRFIAGLAAFLAAHVCYIAGLWTDPPTALAFLVAVIVVVIAAAPVAIRVLGALRDDPAFRVPVAGYILVIGAMVASAVASGRVTAAIGALLFAASDSVIAWNRFVRPLPRTGLLVMVPYHVGQILLVLTLVG